MWYDFDLRKRPDQEKTLCLVSFALTADISHMQVLKSAVSCARWGVAEAWDGCQM